MSNIMTNQNSHQYLFLRQILLTHLLCGEEFTKHTQLVKESGDPRSRRRYAEDDFEKSPDSFSVSHRRLGRRKKDVISQLLREL